MAKIEDTQESIQEDTRKEEGSPQFSNTPQGSHQIGRDLLNLLATNPSNTPKL